MTTNLAVEVRARLPIINPIAVADVEARLGAVPPDRVLNEPGKGLGKCRIKLPSIDPVDDSFNDVGAGTRSVTGATIGVTGMKSSQNAGSMHKIMHQGIDGNHAAADLGPKRPLGRGAE